MDFLLNANKISQQLSQDNRLTSSHVSLYLALLMIWEQNAFANSFTITRKQLMSISKIGSFVTYHKCIKQLEEFGYIKYIPNFNSFIGSQVQIIPKLKEQE
jgi:hypothetical protein